MVFRLVTSEKDLQPKKQIGQTAQQQSLAQNQGNPLGAFARGTAEGGLGAYGNILSLLPGYQAGRQLPGQAARTQAELQLPESQQPGLTGDTSLAPEFGGLPTSLQVNKFLSMLGINKKEETKAEQGLGRAGRLFGAGLSAPVSPLASLSSAVTGAGAAEIGKEAGLGEKGQNVLEFLGGLRGGKFAPKASQTRIRQPRVVERGISPSEAGFISPERMTQQLNRVGKEAADLASNIGQNNPTFNAISKGIHANAPIQYKFNQAFNGLEDIARTHNVPINSQPLNDFLSKEAGQYAKTGSLTDLGKFITGEISGWMNEGSPHLFNMMRRYRLNNEKVREIIDSVPNFQRLSQSQRQQMGFLTRMNDAIKDSFKSSFGSQTPSLPGQSSSKQNWYDIFEKTNEAYSKYLNTKTARSILDPILQKNVTDKQLTSFLSNQRNWENLDKLLGPEETGNLKQIIQDMLTARSAIQGIPRKEVGAEAMKHALLTVIPGIGKVANLISIPKVWQWARGQYHSGPAFQRSFHELATALSEGNAPAIAMAAKNLKEEEKPKKKGFRLQVSL